MRPTARNAALIDYAAPASRCFRARSILGATTGVAPVDQSVGKLSTFGSIVGEVVRPVTGQTTGQAFAELVAAPAHADVWFGVAGDTVTVSFDGIASIASPIEVQSVDGSLIVPDPNQFAGQVRAHTRDSTWTGVVTTAGFVDAGRGIDLIDFVSGQRRTSGQMALRYLDIMTLLQRFADSGVRE